MNLNTESLAKSIYSNFEYKNKNRETDIKEDVKKEFNEIDTWGYRDDQEIWEAGMNVIDNYILQLKYSKGLRVNNEKFGVKDGKATLMTSENIYKNEALSYFKKARDDLAKKYNAVTGIRITSSDTNRQLIHEVACDIDKAENNALQKIKLKCNPMQEQQNEKEKSSVVKDKDGNVKVSANGSEVVRQKPMFTQDNKGILTFTDRSNQPKIHEALKGLFPKGKNYKYKINYKGCTNQNIKNKITQLTGTGECWISYDESAQTYLLRDKHGKIIQSRALIREGVTLQRDELIQWDTYEKEEKRKENLGKIDAPIQSDKNPENDPQLKEMVEDIPESLKKQLKARGNEDYRRFIIETEKRLGDIIKYGKKYGYELHSEPVTTLQISSGLMEVHFIHSETEVDVKVRENDDEKLKNTLGRGLYDFIDKQHYESEYKTYLTTRIKKLWGGKFDELTMKDDLLEGIEPNNNLKESERFPTESVSSLNYGIKILSQFIENHRESEGDSRSDNDDRFLVSMKQELENLRYTVESHRETTKNEDIQAIIDKSIDKLASFWGAYRSINPVPEKEKIKEVFLGSTKENQINALRNMAKGKRINGDVTESSFLADEISTNGEIVQTDKQLIDPKTGQPLLDENGNPIMEKTIQGGLEVEDSVINEKFQNINKLLFTDLQYDSNCDPIGSETQRNIIKDLYTAAGDTKGEQIIGVLIQNNMLPEEWRHDEDVREKAKNIAQSLRQKEAIADSLSISDIKANEQKEKRQLEMKSNKTEEDLQRLQALQFIEENSDSIEVNDIHQNILKRMQDEIRYGGINDLVRSALASEFIDKGGGAKGKNADIYNDIVGYGFWDLSDENVKYWTKELIIEIATEVAITAIAIALSECGAGEAIYVSFRVAKATTQGAKGIKRLATGAKVFGKALGKKIATQYAAKFSVRAAKATGEIAKASHIATAGIRGTYRTIRATETFGSLVGKVAMKGTSMIIEGTTFHINSTILHNIIEGKNLTEGLNPFGSTEYIDPETREKKTIPNRKNYAQSIAFLGVLKTLGKPIQGLTGHAAKRILGESYGVGTAGKMLSNMASMVGEMGSMMGTDQILSLTFDQKFKSVTGQDLISMFGMVAGLRLTNKVNVKIQEYDKKSVTVEMKKGDNTFNVKIDGEGNVLKIEGKDKNGNKIPNPQDVLGIRAGVEGHNVRESLNGKEIGTVKGNVRQLDNLHEGDVITVKHGENDVKLKKNKEGNREIVDGGGIENDGFIAGEEYIAQENSDGSGYHLEPKTEGGPKISLNGKVGVKLGTPARVYNEYRYESGLSEREQTELVEQFDKKLNGDGVEINGEIYTMKTDGDTYTIYKDGKEIAKGKGGVIEDVNFLNTYHKIRTEFLISEEVNTKLFDRFSDEIMSEEGITIGETNYKLEYITDKTNAQTGRKGEIVYTETNTKTGERKTYSVKSDTNLLPDNSDGNRIRERFENARKEYVKTNYEAEKAKLNITEREVETPIEDLRELTQRGRQEIEMENAGIINKTIENINNNQKPKMEKIQKMKENDIKNLLEGKSEIKLDELSANDLRLLMWKSCNMGLDLQTIKKLGETIDNSLTKNKNINKKLKAELKDYVNYMRYVSEIKDFHIDERTPKEEISKIKENLDNIQQKIKEISKRDPIMAKELNIEVNKKKFEIYNETGDKKEAQNMVNEIQRQNKELLSSDRNNFKYRRGFIEADLLQIQIGGEAGAEALKGLKKRAEELWEKTETIGGRTDTETLISKIESGILLGKTIEELQPYLDFLALAEHGIGVEILGGVIQTINTTFNNRTFNDKTLKEFSDNTKKAGEASNNADLLAAGERAETISNKYNDMKNKLANDWNGEFEGGIRNELWEFVNNRPISSISDFGNSFSHPTILLNPRATGSSPIMSIEIGKADYKAANKILKEIGVDKLMEESTNYNKFMKEFNEKLDGRIRGTFGTKNLQELNSSEHRALFDYIAAKFMGGRRGSVTESLTNLSQLFGVKGLQDCRLHAFTKQLLFDARKNSQLQSLEHSKTGNPIQDAEINKKIAIIENTKMTFLDAQFSGNVDMNTIYVTRNEEGYMTRGNQNNVIEEHTFNLIEMPKLDANGNIIGKKVCYADSFYHGNDGKVYDLSYDGTDISETIYGKKGEDVRISTHVTGADGREIQITVKPLGRSMQGRGENIAGSSIETRGPSRSETRKLNKQYERGMQTVETLSKNRAEIKEKLQEELQKLKDGQNIDLEKAFTSKEGHKITEWQEKQIKKAFEVYKDIPSGEKKAEAQKALQRMINNITTENDIEFSSGKKVIDENGKEIEIQLDKKNWNATSFLEKEGVFFDAMKVFNDVYKAKIREATDILSKDPKNPQKIQNLQDAIRKYQEIFNNDIHDFFERFDKQIKREKKMKEEKGWNIDEYQVYDRNNFEKVGERYKDDVEVYNETLNKLEELGMHEQAYELKAQMKSQYSEILRHGQELLGHLINSDAIKSELKGPLGREIYAQLLPIRERLSKGENVDFDKEFGKNSSKVRELLGLKGIDENGNNFDKGRSRKTVEEAIEKIETSGLADYYATIELVYNPHIERILMENAVYGAKEKGYYHTKADGYVSESRDSYIKRMEYEKEIETQIENGKTTISEALLGEEGVLKKNNVLDETSKTQINDLVSEMMDLYEGDFPSKIEAYRFFKATTEVLIHQTMESDTRSMGDHGINHIFGNIRKLNNYLEAEANNIGGDIKQWKLMSYIGHIFHDNGYAALISKGAKHRDGSSLHPFTSKMYFDTNIKGLLEGLKSKGLNTTLISQAIEAHDGIHLDFSTPENIFLSRFNISDNMALGLDKVPALQRHPDILRNRSLLYECSKRGLDIQGKNGLIEEFSRKIDKSNLSASEKEAVKSAISELSRRSFENTDFLSIHPEGNAEVLPNGVRRINMYKAETFLLSAESCGINPETLTQLIDNAKTSGDTTELIKEIKKDKFGKQIIKPLKDYQDNHVLANEKGQEYPKVKNKKGKYEYDRDIISADLLIGKTVQIQDGVKAENNTEFVESKGKTVAEFVFKDEIPDGLKEKGFNLDKKQRGEIHEGAEAILEVRGALETLGKVNSTLTTIKEKVEKGKTITTEEINKFKDAIRDMGYMETGSDNFNIKFKEIRDKTQDFERLLKERDYPVDEIKNGISKIEGLIRTALPTLIQ